MIKGLFISKAGMLPQKAALEVTAKNLANLNTIGYKKQRFFIRHLLDAMAGQSPHENNKALGDTDTDFSPGTLKQTDNPLDVAISGDGFFVIQVNGENLYTRNGSFTLDGEGRLVTLEGDPVVTDGGEVQLQGGKVTINEQGQILVNDRPVARLKIVTFDDPAALERLSGTYFAPGNASETEPDPASIQLRPGYLETSNVDPVQEMVQLIELNREFSLNQKMIRSQDRTLEQLIQKAGSA